MSELKVSKKLEYLKKTGTSEEVISYLHKNEDRIHHKLIVWLGRALQFKFNLISEMKKSDEKIRLDYDDTNVFIGIHVLDYDHKLFDKKTMDGKLVSDLPEDLREVAPVKLVTMMDAVKYIEDWFISVSPNIMNFTIESAYEESRRWHDDLAHQRTTKNYKEDEEEKNVVFKYNQYKIVDIKNKHDLVIEGTKMGHCVGTAGYSSKLSDTYKILSVRDEKNEPHATIELDGKSLKQIKGKQNKTPIDKYIPVIVLWIIEKKLDVSSCHDFLNFPEVIVIDGEEYDLIKYEIVDENLES